MLTESLAGRGLKMACVNLANCDTEGVRGVVGLGYGIKIEQDFDHFLDLFFVGLAVTCNGALRSEERRGGKEGRSRWSPEH